MAAENNYHATHNNMNLTSGSIDEGGPMEKDFSNGTSYSHQYPLLFTYL